MEVGGEWGRMQTVEGGDGVKRGTAGSVWAERGGMGVVGRMRNGGEKGNVAERRGEAVDRRRAPDGSVGGGKMGRRRISPTYSGFRGGFVGLAAGGGELPLIFGGVAGGR